VRLGRTRDDRGPEWIGVRQLAPKRSGVVFRDVAADDTRTLTIPIQPRTFRGRFTLGGTPLAHATLTLHAADFSTSARSRARADAARRRLHAVRHAARRRARCAACGDRAPHRDSVIRVEQPPPVASLEVTK